MLTKDDFLKQYSASTDEELYKMYVTIDDYTGEAKEAIDLEIQRRGGIDVLKNNVRQKQEIINEEIRIQEEAGKLYFSGSDAGLIKKMINSDILTREQVEELIDNKIIQIQYSVEDQKIKPRTIFGSIIGGTIASLI